MSLCHLRRRAIAVALLIELAGREAASLPTAPSDLTTGVSIYEHANFLGDSALLTTSYTNLSKFTGPCEHSGTDANGSVSYTYDWNDCVSSVKLATGWRGTIYRGTNFGDDALEIVADVPNLQLVRGDCDHDGMNDCVSSVRVRQE